MNEILEEEVTLLKRYREGDETALTSLIKLYQQKVFVLALYTSGCDANKAYEITASSFVSAIRKSPSFFGKTPFLRAVIRFAIDSAQNFNTLLAPSQMDSSEPSAVKKEIHRVVRRALLALPLEVRLILLLRDQLNLSYEDVSSILKISQEQVKMKLDNARAQLRQQVETMVGRP